MGSVIETLLGFGLLVTCPPCKIRRLRVIKIDLERLSKSLGLKMLISLKKYVYFFVITLIVTACGGEGERAGFIELPDLRLESLVIETIVQTESDEIVTPVQLNLSGEPVVEFNPSATGPYTAEVGTEITEIRFTAAIPVDSSHNLQLIPFTENENGFTEADVLDLVSGEPFTTGISEGENFFFIRVREQFSGATANYVIEINRPSTSASLENLSFFLRSSITSVGSHGSVEEFLASSNDIGFITSETVDDGSGPVAVTRPDQFSSDEFEYFLAVRYNACNLDVRVVTEQKNASADLDGVSIRNFILSRRQLNFGSNAFTVNVESEVGGNQAQYNFRVFRADSTESDVSEDPHLSSISISEGEFTPLFECVVGSSSIPTYSIVVQPDHDPISLVLESFNSNTIVGISRPLLDENGVIQTSTTSDGVNIVVADTETSQLIRAGESFPHDDVEGDDDFFDLSDRDNIFLIETFLEVDGQNIFRQYLINIFKSVTPFVEVSTAEELQLALQSAIPNQEIIIEDGTYLGEIGAGLSGSDIAHFYSSQSGTQDEPIVLRGRNVGQVILSGGAASQETVLRIEGDHWDIRNLIVDGGATGVTLSNANSNFLSSINISDTRQALIIENASSNNVLRNFVVSSNNQSEGDLPVIQIGGIEVDSDVSGNQIWNSVIGEDVTAELVAIGPNASSTEISFNQFNLDSTNGVSGAVIINAGIDSVIRYNDFTLEADNFSAVQSILSELGVNTLLNDNVFSLNDVSVDIANVSNGIELFESNNQRTDSVVVSYRGEGTTTSFVSSVFQIESAENVGLCLTSRDAVVDISDNQDGSATSEFTAIGLAECLANDDQVWRLVNDGEGFVTIELVNDDQRRLSPTRVSVLSNAITAFERTGDFTDEGFIFRWSLLRESDGSVLLLNKDNLSSNIRVVETPDNFSIDADFIAVMGTLGLTDDSRFNLLPVLP